MLHSSIFSFDTFEHRGPDRSQILRAWLLALALVLLAECGVRLLMGDQRNDAKYWRRTAAVKWENYFRLAEAGHPPDVLVAGDSTAARDVDPDVMRRTWGLPVTVHNLGTDGNNTFAFRADTLSLLRGSWPVPRLVVAQFVPYSLFRQEVANNEHTVSVSPICRELTHQWRPQNYLYLIRTRYWLRARLHEHSEVTPSGFEPLDRIGPESDAVFDKFDIRRDPQGRPLTNPKRVAVFADLASTAQARGFRLVFVIPPAASGLGDDLYLAHKDELAKLAARHSFAIIDLRHDPRVSHDCFADNFHLNRRGAAIYSQQLATLLAPLLPRR